MNRQQPLRKLRGPHSADLHSRSGAGGALPQVPSPWPRLPASPHSSLGLSLTNPRGLEFPPGAKGELPHPKSGKIHAQPRTALGFLGILLPKYLDASFCPTFPHLLRSCLGFFYQLLPPLGILPSCPPPPPPCVVVLLQGEAPPFRAHAPLGSLTQAPFPATRSCAAGGGGRGAARFAYSSWGGAPAPTPPDTYTNPDTRPD